MNLIPDVNGLIEEIRSDRTHGASELARQAMSVLKTAAACSTADTREQLLSELEAAGRELMSVRPAMAPLYNIVRLWLKAVRQASRDNSPESLRHFAAGFADELIQSSLQSLVRIARHTTGLIAGADSIMTYSYSSTVVMALVEAFKRHPDIEVIVARSGAGRIGEKTAQQLADHGLPVIFIDDTAIGVYIAQADRVLVGADRICADGSLVNGAGTYLLALAAARAGKPFHVLCETLKFDSRLMGAEVELEEKEPSEVVAPGKLPETVKVRNPYFDVTPLDLITGVVTENGILPRSEVMQAIA